jgi:hypothetical protein
MGEIIQGSFGRLHDAISTEPTEERPVESVPREQRVAEQLLRAIDEVLEETGDDPDPLVAELRDKSEQMHEELSDAPTPTGDPPPTA